MEVSVDQETCIGCGLCVSSVPTVFRLNDGGKAEVAGQPAAENEAAAEDAARECPVNAIAVR